MIEPIDALQSLNESIAAQPLQNGKLNGSDFSAWLNEQLKEVNTQILDGDTQLRKLALGESDNLHQVMLSLSKAKTSFEFVVQVRNKVLEAYQDIMRMQI